MDWNGTLESTKRWGLFMTQQGPSGISSGHHPHPGKGKGVHAFLSVVITLQWLYNALYNQLVFDNANVLCLLTGKSAVNRGGSDQGRCHTAKRAMSLYSKKPFYPTSWLKRKFKYAFSVPSSFVNDSFRLVFFSRCISPVFYSTCWSINHSLHSHSQIVQDQRF